MELTNLIQHLTTVIGLMCFALSFQFKKENKDIEYGSNFGLAENLNGKGKLLFFSSIVMLSVSIVIEINKL